MTLDKLNGSLSTEVLKDIFEVLEKHKLVYPYAHRDVMIKLRYIELKKQKLKNGQRKYNGKQAREIIANEFFISEKRVQAILYAEK